MITIDLIIDEFMDKTGNWITQRRLQKEYEYVLEVSNKNRTSAEKRWKPQKSGVSDKALKTNENGDATAYATRQETNKSKNSASDKPLNNKETGVCDGNAPIPIPIYNNISPPIVPPLEDEPDAGASLPKKRKRGTRLSEDWQPDDGA